MNVLIDFRIEIGKCIRIDFFPVQPSLLRSRRLMNVRWGISESTYSFMTQQISNKSPSLIIFIRGLQKPMSSINYLSITSHINEFIGNLRNEKKKTVNFYRFSIEKCWIVMISVHTNRFIHDCFNPIPITEPQHTTFTHSYEQTSSSPVHFLLTHCSLPTDG